MPTISAESLPVLGGLQEVSDERRGLSPDPPFSDETRAFPPSGSEVVEAFPADNLPFPDSDGTSWRITHAGGMTPGGRWHETVASHINPTAENGMAWEGETGPHTGIHGLMDPNDIPLETPTLRVEGTVVFTGPVDSVQVGDEVLTPVIIPPIKQGTEIIAARVSSPLDEVRTISEVFSMDYEGSGVQQLAVRTTALQQLTDGPTATVDVEYWLSETITAENPHATKPVENSHHPIDPGTQEKIDEAWEDHLGEPLPTDPSARIFRQVEVLEDLDQRLDPIPTDVDLENPADLVVTVLEQGATNDTASATVLAVSNPNLNVVNGYCNNTDGDSYELSSYETCRWVVDGNGVIYPAGHVYDEPADVSVVYEQHATSLREEPGIVMVPVEEEKPDSVLPLDGVTGVALLVAGGLAALATRAHSGGRRHIRPVSPEYMEASDPFDMLNVTDEQLNKAHQALMHHLWGGGMPEPTRPSALSRAEIAASLTGNGIDHKVMNSLETVPGFSERPDLQLAHQLVTAHVLQAEPISP